MPTLFDHILQRVDEKLAVEDNLASLFRVHRTFVSVVGRGVRNITIDNVE